MPLDSLVLFKIYGVDARSLRQSVAVGRCSSVQSKENNFYINLLTATSVDYVE